MRDIKAGLKKVAGRGKYNAYVYISIESGDELKDKGCSVELICKGPSRGYYFIDWSKSTHSLGAELRKISNDAKRK